MRRRRERLPDKARAAAARAGVLFALTLVAGMVAVLGVIGKALIWLVSLLFAGFFLFLCLFSLLEVAIARQTAREARARARGTYALTPLPPTRRSRWH